MVNPVQDLSGTYVPLLPLMVDTFSRYADGALAGKSPEIGPAWLTTGAQPTTVASGKATSSGVGYSYAAMNPDVLSCDVSWSGTPTSASMAMAWSSSSTFDLANLLHVNFGPTGFTVTCRQDGGTFDVLIAGSWTRPMKTDGTVYRVITAVNGDRLTVMGPDGSVGASVSDPRVTSLRGNWVFWEPNTAAGLTAYLSSIGAFNPPNSQRSAAFVRPGQLGALASAIDSYTVTGGRGKRYAVATGYEYTTQMPAVVFGQPTIFTRLSSPAAISDTSIVVEDAIPRNATIQLESGSNTESVTANNVSPTGTGPFTSTLTAGLAKAHATGMAVIVTTPATAQTFMYLNTENGFFLLPNVAVLVAQQNLYFGNGVDVALRRDASGVLAAFGAGTGKGAFKAGTTTTGARPAAAAAGAGAQMYDTTLSKPIWSDGTTWRDAAGTSV